MIEQLNMRDVSDLYNERRLIHLHLHSLINQINKNKERNLQQEEKYLEIALGVGAENQNGNWSSYDHKLGERILASKNAYSQVINLAKSFLNINDPEEMLRSVYEANISYLKISVGSEMAMMIKPDIFWTANVRTVWAHFLIDKDNYNVSRANDILKIYRSQEHTSEMDYKYWKDIYPKMNGSIEKICSEVNALALKKNIEVGELKYLWFDAIANTLYNQFAYIRR